MKVNSVNNVNFRSLKGLSDPDNRMIFENLSNKYGKDFVKMAQNAFQEISDVSGDEDVFIRFKTTDCVQNSGLTSRTDLAITDTEGREIARELIDFPNSSFTLFGIGEHFKNLTRSFRDFFIPNTSLNSEIDKTINKFA